MAKVGMDYRNPVIQAQQSLGAQDDLGEILDLIRQTRATEGDAIAQHQLLSLRAHLSNAKQACIASVRDSVRARTNAYDEVRA